MVAAANDAIGKLDQESVVASYDSLQSAVDDTNSSGTGGQDNLRGAPLRELANFLKDRDPGLKQGGKGQFAGLSRQSQADGSAIWALL
jgi:hypothetical protein